MKNRISALSFAVALGLSAATSLSLAAELRTVKQPVEGQYIVVLKESAARLGSERSRAADVAVVAQDMASRHRANLLRTYGHALRGFAVRADDHALARLLADPRVEYVEEDGVVHASATQSGATWGIDRTDQRDLPLSGTYTYDTTASSVHALIADQLRKEIGGS